MLGNTQFVERLHFFNGQRLFAEDVQGIDDFNREMRWLHNRSLHQPGIGNGFAVTGLKGDRQVTIGPGYALDAQGREIVLSQAEALPVPPVASDKGRPVLYDLTVAYPDDSMLLEVETRESLCAGQGACTARGAVRLQEAPVFCWVRLEYSTTGEPTAKDPKLGHDITYHVRIRLARMEVLNCQLNKDVSLAERGEARPSCRPFIGCGRYRPLKWDADAEAPPTQPAVYTLVDTSQAGFATTPCYSAHIEGPRDVIKDSKSMTPIFIDVRDATPQGFLLAAYTFDTVGAGPTFDPDRLKDWTIIWMGVES